MIWPFRFSSPTDWDRRALYCSHYSNSRFCLQLLAVPVKQKQGLVHSSSCSSKIGATGFEPATSRPPAERATKLRHTPKINHSCILPNFQLTYTAICWSIICVSLYQNYIKNQPWLLNFRCRMFAFWCNFDGWVEFYGLMEWINRMNIFPILTPNLKNGMMKTWIIKRKGHSRVFGCDLL